jgi:hypothetical protein
MAGLAEHDVLKGRSIYKFGSDAPITQEGFVGLNINIVKGVARFGLGLPLGLTTAAGEGIMAAEETKKVLTGEKETWGEGVDFQLGDAIWADYANRYYDPFAYEVDENGAYVLDEAGEKKFQGYWKGHLDKDNYDAFGEVFSKDPVAYALDVLDVVPAIGFVAKAASVASVAGKASRFGGKVGLTRADVQAAEAANARVVGIDVDKVASAQSIIDKLNDNPNLVDVLDESQIKEAAKIVADNTEAKEALDTAQAKVDMAPSPRKFRRMARAAINGDAKVRTQL